MIQNQKVYFNIVLILAKNKEPSAFVVVFTLLDLRLQNQPRKGIFVAVLMHRKEKN